MRKFTSILLFFAVASLFAQETTFPRRTLMEHFSGASCGYCPYGMNQIVDYINTQVPDIIWVSHHSYGKDEYTIPENNHIASIFNITGAPYVVLNRTKYTGNTIPLDPGSLSRVDLTDTVAEASVHIDHSFDPATRLLNITVSGEVAHTVDTTYLLTVLIKENHLVGPQMDQLQTWKQSMWLEYMHVRVVRDALTASYGDSIHVHDQAYSHTLSYTVDEEWVAENCCIVAYLTPLNKRPIINAEQTPLVAGTTGGEEYLPYGITESAKPMTTIEFDSLQVTQLADTLLQLLFIDNSSVRSIYGYPVKPVVRAYVHTESATLEEGTYPVQADGAPGSIIAGYRNDLAAQLGGSMLMFVPLQELNRGNISPDSQWRINSGEMVVAADGTITFHFITYNNTSVKTSYQPTTTDIKTVTSTSAPKKIMRQGQLLILHDGAEYDLLGNVSYKLCR